MESKTRVVVRRRWHSPDIEAFADDVEVGARMKLTDFIECIVSEMYGTKGQFLMLSKQAAAVKLHAAAEIVIREMKQTTAHVV